MFRHWPFRLENPKWKTKGCRKKRWPPHFKFTLISMFGDMYVQCIVFVGCRLMCVCCLFGFYILFTFTIIQIYFNQRENGHHLSTLTPKSQREQRREKCMQLTLRERAILKNRACSCSIWDGWAYAMRALALNVVTIVRPVDFYRLFCLLIYVLKSHKHSHQ